MLLEHYLNFTEANQRLLCRVQLKMEEAALHQQLESAECERDEIRQQIDAEKVKAKQLDAAEAKYYRDYHEHKRQLLDYEDSQRR